MIEKFPASLDENMEILELERMIAHMEVDLSYHQSQTRFFEKKIMECQNELKRLHHKSHLHSRPHSHYDEKGDDYKM